MSDELSIEIVDYKTFSADLFKMNIEDVRIYQYSKNVEITYTKEGKLYGAKKPFGLDKDDVLHASLESKGIEYSILARKYKGAVPSEESGLVMYSGFLFMMVPAVMIVIILIQAVIIKRMVSKKSI